MALTEGIGDLDRRLADPEWVLAHFTLAADLTALREECRLTADGGMVVARYLALPFAALSSTSPPAPPIGAEGWPGRLWPRWCKRTLLRGERFSSWSSRPTNRRYASTRAWASSACGRCS